VTTIVFTYCFSVIINVCINIGYGPRRWKAFFSRTGYLDKVLCDWRVILWVG